MEGRRQEELHRRHKYLPWALGVQGTLAGLASHHPPEERAGEAAALRHAHTGWAPQVAAGHLTCTFQHTCVLLARALGSSSLSSSSSVPCPHQPRASSEHAPAAGCRRNGRTSEGEGICLSVNNYSVSTLCRPGRRGPRSVGQRRPRAKKYPDKCTVP